nr:MAG TPA: hypothetical protein [Caudoviricetes sp.]
MLFAFLHGGEYSDFWKSIFFPCAITCFIYDAIFAGHCEFPACGRAVRATPVRVDVVKLCRD